MYPTKFNFQRGKLQISLEVPISLPSFSSLSSILHASPSCFFIHDCLTSGATSYVTKEAA